VVSITPWPLYPRGKHPGYSLDRKLGVPQGRSGHRREQKNRLPLPGIEPLFLGRLARSPLLYHMCAETCVSLHVKSPFVQNYWVFGLCPSGILKTRKHNVSETGSVSLLGWAVITYAFRCLKSANLNRWTTHVRSQNQSHIVTDSQSVCLSYDQIFILDWKVTVLFCPVLFLDEYCYSQVRTVCVYKKAFISTGYWISDQGMFIWYHIHYSYLNTWDQAM
jgi:hypothetical protein